MQKDLGAISSYLSWQARSAGVAVAALLAVVTVDSAVGQVNHNEHPGMSQTDCSTSREDKIAAVEMKKQRLEKLIAALDQDIAELSRTIPLTPDGRAKTKLQDSLKREERQRAPLDRDLVNVQHELANASCF